MKTVLQKLCKNRAKTIDSHSATKSVAIKFLDLAPAGVKNAIPKVDTT
jgi:hypothetical protein